MKKNILILGLLVSQINSLAVADNLVINSLLSEYLEAGAVQGSLSEDALKGKMFWQKIYTSSTSIPQRSCASCHSKDLTSIGKHIKTNKSIKPMSPSVNPQRLTSAKKIKKWFKRNCKWTVGRECSAQEKSDLLIFMKNYTKF